MCGRFALGVPHEDIEQMHGYNVRIGEWVGRDNFVPRYNIAPRSQVPVIRRRGQPQDGGNVAGPSNSQNHTTSETRAQPEHETAQASHAPSTEPRMKSNTDAPTPSAESHGPELILHTMKWGLVPHFSKHEDPSLKTINARSEALVESNTGVWASIKGKKRCAVVCQGYYEWLKKGKERLPHFTKHKDGRLMLLAGLWDCTVLEGSTEPLWTFTIVTTDACKEFSWLHDRQPVILPDQAALNTWLDTSPGKWTPELTKLCEPYHASDHPLICYQVPKEVGKIGTDSPTFVQPIHDRKDGIQALFAKQQKASQSQNTSRTSVVPTDVPDTPAPQRVQKRSASPTAVDASEATAKKPKVEKMNTWEDDSDVEYVDDPAAEDSKPKTAKAASSSTPKKGSHESTTSPEQKSGRAPSTTDKKQSTPTRKAKTVPRKAEPASSAKITSFFSKNAK
ncbi:hypothetical protein C8Q77DRAFT_1120414 [Trametes polyzona]|nr:hypothetical protein C8Q77DRAFT_1120414 [Trametes polyzona]